MEIFRAADWQVHYASPAKPNLFSQKLEQLGIPSFSCEANDAKFDAYIQELKPHFVLFDRFITEEQFGWRVEENSPESVRILDTQDLHFLRRAREAALKKGVHLEQIREASDELIRELSEEDLIRELSSIYRSDLTLVISSFELNLLISRYAVPSEMLLLQRLSYPVHLSIELPSFEERRGFVSIGNFRHPPNADAVLWLKTEIWPKIRELLPDAEVHLYGAYPSRESMALTDSSQGFWVKGPAVDQYETLRKYRVLLAPLRYGAGIKGKISDAWSVGTSVVTTPIGAEGMTDSQDLNWAGEIAQNPEEFAQVAVELYQNPSLWAERQTAGFETLRKYYNSALNGRILIGALQSVWRDLGDRRRRNLIGSMLRLNLHRSTKYFSRWIELKQQLKSR